MSKDLTIDHNGMSRARGVHTAPELTADLVAEMIRDGWKEEAIITVFGAEAIAIISAVKGKDAGGFDENGETEDR